VVEFLVLGAKANLDISQTLPVGDLGKRHAEKLIETRKCFYVGVALVLCNATMKGWQRYEVHNLLENQSTGKHLCPPPAFYRGSSSEKDVISSRLWPF
jgi:hypothetical protein